MEGRNGELPFEFFFFLERRYFEGVPGSFSMREGVRGG